MNVPAVPMLAIGLISYNPEASFYERALLARRSGLPVFVFDNSPDRTDAARLLASDTPGPGAELHYITAGKNVGLGLGLATLCATSFAHGFQCLLFFDQDTRFTAETLQYASRFAGTRGNDLMAHYAAVVLQSPEAQPDTGAIRDVVLAISSGMLILLPVAHRIGWHDHSFFVDGVDYEFCLKARAHGMRIGVRAGAPGFDHQAEQPDVPRQFMGRIWRLRKYAPSRVLDSLSAYWRLCWASVRRLDGKALLIVVRSASIFLLGQFLARMPLRRAD